MALYSYECTQNGMSIRSQQNKGAQIAWSGHIRFSNSTDEVALQNIKTHILMYKTFPDTFILS